MASTYSSLKVELIGTGEQTGTWGTTTNTNLGTALEEAIVGRATATFTSDANLTLTLTDTNATQIARNFVLNVTSSVSLSTTRDLIVPAIEKPYIIQNNTTGSQSIRVIVAGGSVTVPNGKTAYIYNDGTDVKAAFDYAPAFTTPSATITGGSISGASISTSSATITGGTINGATIGDVTPAAGTFTSVSTPSATITGGTINGATIGGVTPAAGTFSTMSTPSAAITGGTINNAAIGGVTPAAGTFTSVSTPSATITGGTINNAAIGGVTPAAGAFTSVSGTTATFTGDGTFSGTGQVKLPAGTTGQRSGSPTNGMIRYNSSLGQFEGYASGVWGGIGGAQAGGAIMTNKTTASLDYTVASGENGLSVGPITVDSGVTITVASGQRWLVL